MFKRLWFDLHATVLHAEHALTVSITTPGVPALILRGGPSPLLAGNSTRTLRATPPVPATHVDEHSTDLDGTTDHTWANRTRSSVASSRTFRLPLERRSALAGEALRDVLRRGAHAGHRWCTVDVDAAGLRAVTTRDIRDADDVPRDAIWCDAELTANGLGTYRGQTCPGYRHHGRALARFLPLEVQRLVADTRCSHSTATRFFVTVEDGRTWLVDDVGDRAELLTGTDGWCRVAHPALAWTAQPVQPIQPIQPAQAESVFGSGGPGGVLDRCRICGAVDEAISGTTPSMTGGVNAFIRCAICGSWEGTHPLHGDWQPHPKPWPPQPASPGPRNSRQPGHPHGTPKQAQS